MPSAYAAVKAALVTRLRDRLDGSVTVLDRLPETGEEIQGESGNWEMISFDRAEGDIAVNVFAGPSNLIFDDDLILTCMIQVLMPDSEGTQQAADQRSDELLHEVYAEIADQAAWDFAALGLDAFEYVTVVPAGHRHEPSMLSQEGHAAKVELGIRIRARYSFN